MGKLIKRLLLLVTVVSVVAGAAYCITRFLLATDDMSGSDGDKGDTVHHEPVIRHYTKLHLPL